MNPGRFNHFPVRSWVVSHTFLSVPSRFAPESFRPLSHSHYRVAIFMKMPMNMPVIIKIYCLNNFSCDANIIQKAKQKVLNSRSRIWTFFAFKTNRRAMKKMSATYASLTSITGTILFTWMANAKACALKQMEPWSRRSPSREKAEWWGWGNKIIFWPNYSRLELSQPMWKRYSSHGRSAKAQSSMRIRSVWPEPKCSRTQYTWYRGPEKVQFQAKSRWVAANAQLKYHEPHNTNKLTLYSNAQITIWAATWQNQQCGYALSEDSDQPGHPPSLISLRCPHEESLGP